MTTEQKVEFMAELGIELQVHLIKWTPLNVQYITICYHVTLHLTTEPSQQVPSIKTNETAS